MADKELSVPKEIDILLSEINGNKAFFNSITSPVSLRVPDLILAEVDAIAHETGQNRSQTINRLLSIALEHVREGMSEEKQKHIDELAEKYQFGEFKSKKGDSQ